MFNQFVGCRMTVSGTRYHEPAVLAITFASATELSSPAALVYVLMPERS